jgi:hypothetical protein
MKKLIPLQHNIFEINIDFFLLLVFFPALLVWVLACKNYLLKDIFVSNENKTPFFYDIS